MAARMRAIVAKTSWDNTAAQMHHLIQTTPPGQKAQRLAAPAAPVDTAANAINVNPLPVPAVPAVPKGHWKAAAASVAPTGVSAA